MTEFRDTEPSGVSRLREETEAAFEIERELLSWVFFWSAALMGLITALYVMM